MIKLNQNICTTMYRPEQGYEPVFQEWFPNCELSKPRAAAEDVTRCAEIMDFFIADYSKSYR